MIDSIPKPKPAPFRALVICPDERPAVPALSRRCPLALSPFLGATVLEHALASLATRGATAVTLLAGDRADVIRAAVGNGEAWGLRLEVCAQYRELTPDEALAKHGAARESDGLPRAREALLLDHLPSLPLHPLWESYTAWFKAMLAFAEFAAKERVGVREVAAGVFVGMRSRIANSARLIGPCWIGANTFIGPLAMVGPDAVIEDDAYVEESAEVVSSVIGPSTYLGALTEVRHSFAWGRHLLNLPSGSSTEIADRFLLDDLGSSSRSESSRRDEAAKLASLPVLESIAPAVMLERARAIAPGFWRKWSRRAGDAGPS